MISQGDAGSATWATYRETVIKRSRACISMAISPAVYSERYDRGCFDNLDEIDVDACVDVIAVDGGEYIWDVAANLASRRSTMTIVRSREGSWRLPNEPENPCSST